MTVNTWVELDVTSAITGNGTYSFAVSGGSSNVVDYSSSEGPNPPQLVVVAAGSAPMSSADSPRVDAAAAPGEMALHANRPNPFHGETAIQYGLPQAMPVRLVIYDVSGRVARELADGVRGAGERRVTWDGRDDRGFVARAGV